VAITDFGDAGIALGAPVAGGVEAAPARVLLLVAVEHPAGDRRVLSGATGDQ
jgi:hypothetical protein